MRAPVIPMSQEVARTEVAAWVEKVARLLPDLLAEAWRSLPAQPDPWTDLKLRLAVLEPVLEYLRWAESPHRDLGCGPGPAPYRATPSRSVSRALPDQRWLDLVVLPDGEAKLIVAPDVFSLEPDAVYRYRQLGDACDAFDAWAGAGEPVGWYRREPDDR